MCDVTWMPVDHAASPSPVWAGPMTAAPERRGAGSHERRVERQAERRPPGGREDAGRARRRAAGARRRATAPAVPVPRWLLRVLGKGGQGTPPGR